MWAWNDFGVWLLKEILDIGRSVARLVRRSASMEGVPASAKASGVTGYIKFSPGKAWSVESKVDFLLDQVSHHEDELQRMEKAHKSTIEELRAEVLDHLAEQINRLRTDNI